MFVMYVLHVNPRDLTFAVGATLLAKSALFANLALQNVIVDPVIQALTPPQGFQGSVNLGCSPLLYDYLFVVLLMEERYYSIPPDIAVVNQEDGTVLFRSDMVAIKLEGQSARLFASSILPRLNGQTSLLELLQQLQIPKSELLPYLDHLVHLHILKVENIPHSSEKSNFENFLALFNIRV